MAKKKKTTTNESMDKRKYKRKMNTVKHKYSTRKNKLVYTATYNVNEFSKLWNKATSAINTDIEGTSAVKAANQSVSSTDSSSQRKAMYGRLLPNGLDVSYNSNDSHLTNISFS